MTEAAHIRMAQRGTWQNDLSAVLTPAEQKQIMQQAGDEAIQHRSLRGRVRDSLTDVRNRAQAKFGRIREQLSAPNRKEMAMAWADKHVAPRMPSSQLKTRMSLRHADRSAFYAEIKADVSLHILFF
jgi:ElaB/YqjD/DUF883 family membrane-anchored ribosome-binding protein